MNLFTYLLAKKGKNSLLHGDLFSYLLGKRTSQTQTISGVTIYIPDAKPERIESLIMTKESTQDGEPTPENPVEVKTVKGYEKDGNNWIDVKITGKNLNSSVLERGSISSTTGENIPGNQSRSKDFILVEPNTEYTVSASIQTPIGVRCYDKNQTFLSSITGSAQPKTFTTPNNCYYVRFTVVSGDLTNLIQLEKGNEAITYEEYKETIVPIPLNGNEIAGIGDYKDELLVDKNGHCWLNKKTQKLILNGTEDWVRYTTASKFRYELTIQNTEKISGDTIADVICSHFLPTSPNGSWTGTMGVSLGSGNKLLICYEDEKVNTIALFKEWLSNNNVIVICPLATPDLIDLNTTVDIRLFKGVNNITNSENCTMSLTYEKMSN